MGALCILYSAEICGIEGDFIEYKSSIVCSLPQRICRWDSPRLAQNSRHFFKACDIYTYIYLYLSIYKSSSILAVREVHLTQKKYIWQLSPLSVYGKWGYWKLFRKIAMHIKAKIHLNKNHSDYNVCWFCMMLLVHFALQRQQE